MVKEFQRQYLVLFVFTSHPFRETSRLWHPPGYYWGGSVAPLRISTDKTTCPREDMKTLGYLSPRLGIFLIYSEISHQSIVKAWSWIPWILKRETSRVVREMNNDHPRWIWTSKNESRRSGEFLLNEVQVAEKFDESYTMQVSPLESHPALTLLQATLQAVPQKTPPVQPSSDAVDISNTAKQLAQTRPAKE